MASTTGIRRRTASDGGTCAITVIGQGVGSGRAWPRSARWCRRGGHAQLSGWWVSDSATCPRPICGSDRVGSRDDALGSSSLRECHYGGDAESHPHERARAFARGGGRHGVWGVPTGRSWLRPRRPDLGLPANHGLIVQRVLSHMLIAYVILQIWLLSPAVEMVNVWS